MIYSTRITQKGQLTLPKPIREELSLTPNLQIMLWLENSALKIKPMKTILDLAGSFKPQKTTNAISLRDKMSKSYGKR